MRDRTRKIGRASGLLTALATLAALTVPLVAPPAQANHGSRTLEIGNCTVQVASIGTPCPDSNDAIIKEEETSGGAGTIHTIRAMLRNSTSTQYSSADVPSGPINIDFEIESGPGDVSGPGNPAGNSPVLPDYSCTIPIGSDNCEIQYTSNVTGSERISAWIDHDNNNATADAGHYDANENRISDPTTDCGDLGTPPSVPADCQSSPGDTDEIPDDGDIADPDRTDVIEWSWSSGAAANLNCEPETATAPSTDDPNTTGNQTGVTVTCSITDEFGNPKGRIDVDAENLGGANDPDNASADPSDYDNISGGEHDFCESTNSGTCSASISAIDGEAGSANICLWLDSNPGDSAFNAAGNEQDGGDCDVETQGQEDADLTDTITITWQARTAAGGGLDAEPETDVNDTGTNHVVTATVYDQFGTPFVSTTQVKFEFFQGSPASADGNTPGSPDLSCTTNNSSSCSVTYTSNTAGRDRMCVWINSDPTMAGDNQNGTCDGGNGPEGLNDADDAAGSPDAPDPANDDVDVVEKIWGAPGQAARLDCEPETDTNPSGTTHQVTCTATDAQGARVSGARIDAEATGANDPDASASRTSPDFTCTTIADDPLTPTTNEAGTCSFRHGPDGGVGSTTTTGLTTYRAWIDIDNNNATDEADGSEGRDEAVTPGAKAEPDDTDVVEKSWVAQPASVTISPKTDTASVGRCNPYTITALNSSNQPAQGAVLDVEQRHVLASNNTQNDEPKVSFCVPAASDGPNPSDVDTTAGDLGPNSTSPEKEDPDNPGTAGGETTKSTDASGKITIGIRVEPMNNSDGSGQVDLTVWFETADNDDPDANEPKDTAGKIWEKAEARTIDCEPETATNDTGTNHTVTCTVEDRSGDPVEGEDVTFTETGPGSFVGANTDSSDANGQVEATVTSNEAGNQTITGTLNRDLQGNEPSEVDECDRAANDPTGAPAGACEDSVTKTWETPTGSNECEDGLDNDGDGQIDHPNDPGCDSPTDDDETDPACPGFEGDPRNQIVGTPGNDTLVGSPGDDVICAGAGDDSIDGGGGDDLIFGGDGQDDISGGAGDDEIRGEGGKDTIRGNGGADDLFGGNQNDVIIGNAGEDLMAGNKGEDVMRGGADADTVRGGTDDDTIQGGRGKDLLKGGAGKDTMRGKQGDDTIRGGTDDDVLRGGGGNDKLNGGGGNDTCRGGPGNDKRFNCEN